MALSFTQASFALAFAAGVKPEKAGTFESRLKQWQKMGFPDGVNVGRGVRASYGPTQLYQLGIMLKLMQLGLTPERAIQVVRTGWPVFKDMISEATSCIANRVDHLHYCLVRIDALSDLTDPGSDHLHVSVWPVDSESLKFLLSDESELEDIDWQDGEREAFQAESYMLKNGLAISLTIEIDSLLILLWVAINACGGSLADFQDESAEWYLERKKRRRSRSDNIEYYNKLSTLSVMNAARDFDAAAAAQEILAKVAIRADDPQA